MWFSNDYERGYQSGRSDERNRQSLGPLTSLGFYALAGALLIGWLYPFTAAITVAVVYGLFKLMHPIALQLDGPNLYLVAIGVPGFVGVAVLAGAYRLDLYLARFGIYWWIRHAVRLLLLAALTFVVHFRAQYDYWPGTMSDVAKSAGGAISLLLVLMVCCLAHLLLRMARRGIAKDGMLDMALEAIGSLKRR